ncbi:hypothetical protein LJT59_002076 [Escherichia coli]|nr:hypothetical protein [Escherichia coli]
MSKLTLAQQDVLCLINAGVNVTFSRISGSYYCQETGEYVTKQVEALLKKGLVKVSETAGKFRVEAAQ